MPPLQSDRILDQLRERIRYMHYSLGTEEAYVYWAKAFIRFHELRHPADAMSGAKGAGLAFSSPQANRPPERYPPAWVNRFG